MSDTALTTPAKPDALSTMLGFRTISITELSDEQKRVLKDSVAKETTDTELAYFLNVAMAQELNPFNKEVWSIKYGGKLTVQTGRDGFLKIAKRDPTFDYIQSAEVRENDDFRMDLITGQIEHRITPKRGQILGAWALITRKDGVKIAKYVTWTDYFDASAPMWKDYPTAMITKCAESVLCKQFANVTGIVAEETMRKDGTVIDNSPSAQAQQNTLKDDLIKQIEACTTFEGFKKLRDDIAGMAGKLFGAEKEAVYAAAKKKKAELEIAPQIIEHATVESVVMQNDGTVEMNLKDVEARDMTPEEQASTAAPAPQMEADEFQSWLEGIKAQETVQGILDLRDAAFDKPMSPEQHATFTNAWQQAKDELEKPKQAKKKKSA